MEMCTIGMKIRELRKRQRMTQVTVASELMVTPQAVSKWENDISYPDIMTLKPLCMILGTTVDDLLTLAPTG